MHDKRTREHALRLLRSGRTVSEVARETELPRSTVSGWHHARPRVGGRRGRQPCQRCDGRELDAEAYAYLLGLYLGDGVVSHLRRGVYSLRIACCDAYPGLMQECEDALRAVHGGNVHRVSAPGCHHVQSLWKHWPCLFPQHGPGKKHERKIELHPWQQEVADLHPGLLLRGLLHSDGCRMTNWVTRYYRGNVKRYEYPRYFFTNNSPDIMAICQEALDQVGVEWKQPRWNMLSVNKREAVARLDEHVGLKY